MSIIEGPDLSSELRSADFERKDVERSFTKTIFERGRQYANSGHVLDAWYDEYGDLVGEVKGSGRQHYTVEVVCSPRQRFTKLESTCSCPHGSQCKHGAAVALYSLSHPLRTEELDDDFGVLQLAPEPAKDSFDLPVAQPVSLDIRLPYGVTEWFENIARTAADLYGLDPAAKQRVLYKLASTRLTSGYEAATVAAVTRNILKDGSYGVETKVKPDAAAAYQRPKGWAPIDHILLRDLRSNTPQPDQYKAEYRLDERHGTRLLRDILKTGRCLWSDGQPLNLGSPRAGKFKWKQIGKKGQCSPSIEFEGSGIVISAITPWYVDLTKRECGPLECELRPEVAAAFIRSGAIEPEHLPGIRAKLIEMGTPEELHPPETLKVVVRSPEPVTCLRVDFEACNRKTSTWAPLAATAPIAFAKLGFEYEGMKAPADEADLRIFGDGEVTVLKRNLPLERQTHEFLQRQGWRETAYSGWDTPKGRVGSLCMVPPDTTRLIEPLERVAEFASTTARKLIAAGWKVEIDENIRYLPESAVEWDVSLDSTSGIDWFEFQLGIKVEGQRLDLRSVLSQVFKEKGGSANVKSDDFFYFSPGGAVVKLSRQRLNAILQPLIELFGGVTEWPENLRLPKAAFPSVARFEESAAAANVPWRTTEELATLGMRFKTFDRLEPHSEPAGFAGELREYQKEGLAWLQFLREYGFGGVLADDMGLGKTVQILSHIQTEKTAGRLDRPCLIVAPTSTIPNWKRECERFAPELKVVVLQGDGRSERYSDLQNIDIALTTYPLLARDKDKLAKQDYHFLVLDEAQNIKNPVTAVAKAARELLARHRIALSGTPIENHLGEMWSLFHFLMPGFLGTDTDFKKRFRGPIEKNGDARARDELARRIRPFMLRRTKSQVVRELPPKTVIVETVEFDDHQRDLYESIRAAMDEQVRDLIASQGFNKSRIQILDALLKLRQVCCDPRLVKMPSARTVESSAKLQRLMEMLGVLLEDGRRVLLFSQFTSMLDLVEVKLREEQIGWVRISGDTKDRETPVRQFQCGAAKLFLISLKAGGTGLNLTAADTVILYDPWWNPAVENQAIDRAHRIGQEKAVIVYKMVAARTIEEKILELQARKGDIARSILTDDAEGIQTITADDLRWVLSRD